MQKNIILFCWAIFTLPAYAQTEGYAPADGVRIYYRIFGKGEPLLIINGGPGGNSEGFAQIGGMMGEKYQAIIFDQRGVGKSTLPALNTQTITMDLMREDMEALRKHLGIKAWTIMGQSFGGILSSYYTAKYPQYVKGLIYSASGGLDLEFTKYIQARIQQNLTPTERDSLNFYSQKLNQGDTTLHTRQKRAYFLASAYIIDKKFLPTIAARLMQIDMNVNGIVFQDLTKINYDTKKALQSFQKPVLILQGRQDIIAPEIAQTAHKVFPNSRLVMLANCAHYGWLDAKEKYMREVHKFMQKIPKD
jgi:proline iminopeptidase